VIGTPDAVLGRVEAADGWARRRARVARHIERTAIELLADAGEEGITVEQIASAAGISVRTFFRYFPSRDAVFTALPRRLNDVTCGRVAERPSDESLLASFIAAVHLGMDPEDEELILLWGRAVQGGFRPRPQSDGGMVGAYADVIAARRGIDPDSLTAQVLATAIASVMWSTFVRWLEQGGRESLPTLIERAFAALTELDDPTAPATRRRPRPRLA